MRRIEWWYFEAIYLTFCRFMKICKWFFGVFQFFEDWEVIWPQTKKINCGTFLSFRLSYKIWGKRPLVKNTSGYSDNLFWKKFHSTNADWRKLISVFGYARAIAARRFFRTLCGHAFCTQNEKKNKNSIFCSLEKIILDSALPSIVYTNKIS